MTGASEKIRGRDRGGKKEEDMKGRRNIGGVGGR